MKPMRIRSLVLVLTAWCLSMLPPLFCAQAQTAPRTPGGAGAAAQQTPAPPVVDYKLQFELQRVVTDLTTLDAQRAQLLAQMESLQARGQAVCGSGYVFQYAQQVREWRCVERPKPPAAPKPDQKTK